MLHNTLEIQAVRDDIQAYLTAAMAQTAEIINQARAPSVLVESSHSRQLPSRSQPLNPRGSRNNDPSDNRQGGNGGHDGGQDDNRRREDNRRDIRDDNHRDNHDNRRDNRGRRANPDGNRDRRDGNNDLRHYLGGCDLRARINQRADDRASYESYRRMEYDTAHGPLGLKQFTPHLRQVIWPKNFKLEKLQKYNGKENPELWVMLYETACRSAMADEHVI